MTAQNIMPSVVDFTIDKVKICKLLDKYKSLP